ncbi:LysR family transcriptional regulator [Pseudophaeobacter sp. EL27]|uniref:LysR family transcriptional regulator n=1 Tax=Pseudophaeobacter sp. EL27 TaxID=2107580 RepID=UPI000EFB952C|nr:LysR family transcriptional regulator [Pseudophaeobacter sp. EL27]
MQDWKPLPAFLAVARHGSLRAAAVAIDSTHATLRRQIEALEAGLRVQLFRRGGDGLHLTAAGRALLPQALEAEALLLKGFNAVQGLDREATGRVRLSADPMTAHYLLAPVLAEFCKLYPDIHIDQMLPASGPKGRGLTWIGYGAEPSLMAMIANSPFPEAKIRHSIPDPQMHLHMARAGAGMTFLASWVQKEFPELQRVPGTELNQERSTWLLLHGDLRRVLRVRLLVDYLHAALQERRVDFIGP